MSSEPPTVSDADPNALIAEGRKLLRAKKLPLAAAHFERAVELNPASVEGHEMAAKCAFAVKNHAKAEEHFRAAAKCDARRVEPLVNLGAVMNVQKNYAGAIKCLQKAVAKKAGRSNAQAYYNLGIAYRGAGQSAMAVQAYREAIRLNSDFAEAHQNLGNAYLDQNNARQAKICFTRALELKPKLAGASRGLEKANASTSTRDPFGGIAAGGRGVGPTVALSETARINDRASIRDITERVDRSLRAWSSEVRNDLEPTVRSTVKAISGAADPTALLADVRKLDGCVHDCGEILAVLGGATADLREHENRIATGE